jgi:hypothetical protein
MPHSPHTDQDHHRDRREDDSSGDDNDAGSDRDGGVCYRLKRVWRPHPLPLRL